MQEQSNQSGKYLALALCVTGSMLWGTIGIFVKKIEFITPLGIAAGRLIIAFVGVLLFVLISPNRRQALLDSVSSYKFYLLLSFLMSLHFICSIWGFHETTVANASLLNNTVPIFVPFFAWFIIGEKSNRSEYIGISVSVVGMILVFSAYELSLTSGYFRGNVFATLSALLLGVYIVLSRKIRQCHSAATVMTWLFGFGGVFIILEGLAFRDPFFEVISVSDLFYLLGLGVFGTFIAHTSFNASLKVLRSTTASVIGLVSPLVATGLAIAILSELPTTLTVFGMVITLLGILFVVTRGDPPENELEKVT